MWNCIHTRYCTERTHFFGLDNGVHCKVSDVQSGEKGTAEAVTAFHQFQEAAATERTLNVCGMVVARDEFPCQLTEAGSDLLFGQPREFGVGFHGCDVPGQNRDRDAEHRSLAEM